MGKQPRISIYFYESEKLLKGDRKLKEEVLNFFEELIEFWRDEENIGFIDGEKGKTKDFRVYLVD